MIQIKNQKELEQLLILNGIEVSPWGSGSAKTLTDLWHEIIEGETLIRLNPLFRVLSIVRLVIRQGNNILEEIEQELEDGRIRSRNYLPSEKLKLGESVLNAAMRCLQEELGIVRESFTIFNSTFKTSQAIRESLSYPQLRTLYIINTVEANVRGLPVTDFWTDEQRYYRGKDPVKRHHWGWKVESDILD